MAKSSMTKVDHLTSCEPDFSVVRYCSVYQSDKFVVLSDPGGRVVTISKNVVKLMVSNELNKSSDFVFMFNCFGLLGSVTFTGKKYLIVVTEAVKCGRLLLEHDVYKIKSHRLIPLFHPVTLTSKERDFIRLFNDFDISNHFYFSYTYNLSNSLQINLSLQSQNNSIHYVDKVNPGDTVMDIFDPVITLQKYCYNYTHRQDLLTSNERAVDLSLVVIHGYFSESAVCVCGRSLTFSLISRRSRFYAGTRYRKRGITGDGNVANEVETEQILHDWSMTRSVSSFTLLRGSIPLFWSQDPSESLLKKPPIIYSQTDPTNSSTRAHFNQLFATYGSPIAVLDLLSDNSLTEESELSSRYRLMIDELNAEIPKEHRIRYFSKNIKLLLERGIAKQRLKEVVDFVLEHIQLFYFTNFNGLNYGVSDSIQSGVIRVSCLDCLDRTSAFAKHLSIRVLKRQLELIGTRVNYELPTYYLSKPINSAEVVVISDHFGFNYVRGELFEVVRDRYEEMCDAISMQYAGSKALKKYEGQSTAINISRELFTNVRRRYRSYFEDTKIQQQINAFLCYPSLSHFAKLGEDFQILDDFIHFRRINVNFDYTDSFLLSLLTFQKRVQLLSPSHSPDLLDRLYYLLLKLVDFNTSEICDTRESCNVGEIFDVGEGERVVYPTIGLVEKEDGYESLEKFKPTSKIVQLTNVCNTDFQVNFKPKSAPTAEPVKTQSTLNIVDNTKDYKGYLQPIYKYNEIQAQFIPHCNYSSLYNYINVTTQTNPIQLLQLY